MNAEVKDNEAVVERVFNSSVEDVYSAWTTPEKIEQWYGPQGFTTTVTEYDLKVGGKFTLVMKGPNNMEMPISGEFEEIIPGEKIVTVDRMPMGPGKMAEMKVVVEFHKISDTETKLVMKNILGSKEEKENHVRMGAMAGWESSFQKLDAVLGG